MDSGNSADLVDLVEENDSGLSSLDATNVRVQLIFCNKLVKVIRSLTYNWHLEEASQWHSQCPRRRIRPVSMLYSRKSQKERLGTSRSSVRGASFPIPWDRASKCCSSRASVCDSFPRAVLIRDGVAGVVRAVGVAPRSELSSSWYARSQKCAASLRCGPSDRQPAASCYWSTTVAANYDKFVCNDYKQPLITPSSPALVPPHAGRDTPWSSWAAVVVFAAPSPTLPLLSSSSPSRLGRRRSGDIFRTWRSALRWRTSRRVCRDRRTWGTTTCSSCSAVPCRCPFPIRFRWWASTSRLCHRHSLALLLTYHRHV